MDIFSLKGNQNKHEIFAILILFSVKKTHRFFILFKVLRIKIL
jgi:hypothetical protein